MDSGSKEKLSKQLRDLQGLKETDPFWQAHQKQFGMSREDVIGFDTLRHDRLLRPSLVAAVNE